MANFTGNNVKTLPKSDKMPKSLKKRPHKMPCIAFSEGGLIVYTCQKAATLQRNAGSARKPGNVPVHPAGVSSKENHDNMMARKSVFHATITGRQAIIFLKESPDTVKPVSLIMRPENFFKKSGQRFQKPWYSRIRGK